MRIGAERTKGTMNENTKDARAALMESELSEIATLLRNIENMPCNKMDVWHMPDRQKMRLQDLCLEQGDPSLVRVPVCTVTSEDVIHEAGRRMVENHECVERVMDTLNRLSEGITETLNSLIQRLHHCETNTGNPNATHWKAINHEIEVLAKCASLMRLEAYNTGAEIMTREDRARIRAYVGS